MSKRYSLAEQKIRSIGEIARLIHSEDDLDTLLEQVNHGISRHSVWALSSIVAVDFTEGRTYLVSTSSPYGTTDDPAYSDRSWHISDSPSAQAVQSEEMIIIEDAQNQDRSPGYRQQARDLGYRTLVIVPIGAVDDHGRPLVLSLKARDITEVSQLEREFVRTIADLAALAVEKVKKIRLEAQTSRRLARSVTDYSDLMRTALSTASRAAIVDRLDVMLPFPWIVVDFMSLSLTCSRRPIRELDGAPWKALSEVGAGAERLKHLRALMAGDPSLDGPVLPVDLMEGSEPAKAYVEALKVDNEVFGAFLIFPDAEPLDSLHFVIGRAAHFAISVQLMRNYVQFRSVSHSRTDVLHRLFDGSWKSKDDIIAHAVHNDIDPTRPQIMLLIGYPERSRPESVTLALHAIMRSVGHAFGEGVVAMYGGGVVVLVPECAARKLGDANIRRQFWNDVQWTFGDEALIVQCDTCRIIEDYQLSYAQGEKIVKLASSLRLAGWINRQDLRSSIVLLSLADDKIVSAFLENGIRRIVDHDRQHHTDYFVTLKAFVEHEGRFQSSAEALGLHPTTLRYRISRLEELFGIDATTAATRFELQLAIKLLELGSMRVQQT